MYKILFTINFSLLLTIALSQQYTKIQILKKADSMLISKVGQRIFNDFYSFDSLSYYEYRTKKGKTKWRTLTKDNATKGNFISMRVRYNFCLKNLNISCNMSIAELDNHLNLKDTFNTDFIPQYVLDNTECNFISEESAITVAKSKFSRQGIKPISAGLGYDYQKKIYTWTLDNILAQKIDGFGKNYGEIEIVKINALNGTVLSFCPNAIYGAVR